MSLTRRAVTVRCLGHIVPRACGYTHETKGNAARIADAGVITEGKAVKGSVPFGITVALNGDTWYTMMAANKIATLNLR